MLNKYVSSVILAAVASGSLHGARSLAAPAGSKPTLDAVRAAWRSREKAVRSARFEWTGTLTYDRYAQPFDGIPGRARIALSSKKRYSLALDGPKLRYTWSGMEEASRRDKRLVWIDQTYTEVFTTEEHVSHFAKTTPVEPSAAPSVGFISLPGSEIPSKNNYNRDPLLMHYRALDPKFSNIEGDLTLTDGSGVVDGRRCLIVVDRGQAKTEYWVDPQRDYSIVRIRRYGTFRPDKCLEENEISYKSDARFGWTPAGWRGYAVDADSGQPADKWDYTLISYAINPRVDPSEFRYQFPPGTWVVDRRTKSLVQYIVREGGKKRMITDAESGAAYEDLLRTESGGAVPRKTDGVHESKK